MNIVSLARVTAFAMAFVVAYSALGQQSSYQTFVRVSPSEEPDHVLVYVQVRNRTVSRDMSIASFAMEAGESAVIENRHLDLPDRRYEFEASIEAAEGRTLLVSIITRVFVDDQLVFEGEVNLDRVVIQ